MSEFAQKEKTCLEACRLVVAGVQEAGAHKARLDLQCKLTPNQIVGILCMLKRPGCFMTTRLQTVSPGASLHTAPLQDSNTAVNWQLSLAGTVLPQGWQVMMTQHVPQ